MTHRTIKTALLASVAALSASLIGPSGAFAAGKPSKIEYVAPTAVTAHRTIEIDGLKIFYREAGDPSRPTVVLFHGFPTSSTMFRELIPALAERYHVLAPDYPGYGGSDAPAAGEFDYSFEKLADVTEAFLTAKGVETFTAYVMDYGAPVGFRVFERNPERIEGFIVQNGNAYLEGLEEFWDPIRAYWNDGSTESRDALRQLLTRRRD